MNSGEIRKKFLDFFKRKGHKIIPSSSLIPEDSSVLFTTAGMQQLTMYLQGTKDPLEDFNSRHLASCQKCFRTDDIEEVGDDTHHTFFEMLGNWSIGEDPEKGYFKEGAIEYALSFLVDELGMEKDRLWVTIFKGEKGIERDTASQGFWIEKGIPQERIREFDMQDNFWGPVAKTGPCGPCSEIFYDRGESFGCGSPDCGPNCEQCNRFVEVWNLVFMQYFKNENGGYDLLSQTNVDTGIGFERLTALLQGKSSAYETDLFLPVIQELESMPSIKNVRQGKFSRILADHVRGIVFIASEGITPSNLGRGYILRRLLRRCIRFGRLLELPDDFLISLAQKTITAYRDIYPKIQSCQADILTVIQKEQERFKETLEQGLEELHKIFDDFNEQYKAPRSVSPDKIGENLGKQFFFVYQTYGFPLELSLEEFKSYFSEGMSPLLKNKIEESFSKEFEKHQDISRAGAEKKFGGIGKQATYEATKLHTTTHLLQQALREVLGPHVEQKGSDINPQRLRFDFSHPKEITSEEVKKVEDLVNQKIKDNLEVKKEEMSYKKALGSGALAVFDKEKYPEKVTVYSVVEPSGEAFSKEICGGPHVKRTGELGHFKITKEKSSGAGIRRIKAVLE